MGSVAAYRQPSLLDTWILPGKASWLQAFFIHPVRRSPLVDRCYYTSVLALPLERCFCVAVTF